MFSDLTIRRSTSADARAIERVAALDSQRAPGSAELLVAELDGELVAALALDGGAVVADPFRPTAEIVALLELRAGQLREGKSPARGAPALGRLRRARDLAGWSLPRRSGGRGEKTAAG